MSGRATVHSFTVNHQQWIPGSEPYIVGLVAIAEQPEVRLMTNLIDCDPDDSLIGREVEVIFEHCDGVYVPLFRPVATVDPVTPVAPRSDDPDRSSAAEDWTKGRR